MSRSNNTEIKNPAVQFFSWSGDSGKIKYFDKSLGEKGENVFLDLPFTFLVLDRLVTITGYSDEDKSGFWSNEIRNTKTELLTVRTKKGIVQTGLYDEVKHLVGAKFAQSVYIAFYDAEKNLQIGNFKMSGSAIGAWIDFSKSNDVYKGAIKIADKKAEKKGKTDYFVPVFQMREVSEETEVTAQELDKQLQEYLEAYFKRAGYDEAPPKAQAASAGNDDYISQRNAEIESFDDNVMPSETELGDDDIPF